MRETFGAELTRSLLGRIKELEKQVRALVMTAGQYLDERMFVKTGLVDNTATAVFQITNYNPSGSDGAGGYVCEVTALIGHAVTDGAATNTAVKAFKAHFSRAVRDDGDAVDSAVLEISETASGATASATRDIGTVTMTVVDVSKYVAEIKFQIDLTGSGVTTAEVVCVARLIWHGFTTPPEMSPV